MTSARCSKTALVRIIQRTNEYLADKYLVRHPRGFDANECFSHGQPCCSMYLVLVAIFDVFESIRHRVTIRIGVTSMWDLSDTRYVIWVTRSSELNRRPLNSLIVVAVRRCIMYGSNGKWHRKQTRCLLDENSHFTQCRLNTWVNTFAACLNMSALSGGRR